MLRETEEMYFFFLSYENLCNGTSLTTWFEEEKEQLREDENASHLNKHSIKRVEQCISLWQTEQQLWIHLVLLESMFMSILFKR